MPKYISAYDLQQREGLTRCEILELAEKGQAFFRVHEADIAHLDFYDRHHGISRVAYGPDGEACGLIPAYPDIDASLMTTDRSYWLNGFEKLRKEALADWQQLIGNFKNIIQQRGYIPDSDEICRELRLDDWLGNHLPEYITGGDCAKLFGKYCPAAIRDNPNGKFSKCKILEETTSEGKCEGILNGFFIYKEMDVWGLWIEMKYSQNIIFDLFFETYFQNWLFFQENTSGNGAPPSPTRQKAEISQIEAADLARVTPKTIKNWDAGKSTPEGYPGRGSRSAFLMFVERRAHDQRSKAAAREVNRATTGGDMQQYSQGMEYR